MTHSGLTLNNLNQRGRYIYLGSIFVVIIGLCVLIVMQYSDTSENTVRSRNIIRTETDRQYPIENNIDTSTGNMVAIATGNSIDTSTGNIVTASMGMIVQDVPFTSQAPFAEWWNILYQEGCEEASIIMAIAWATSQAAISPEDANAQILAIADFEQKEFWTYMHASIYDIATTMSDYLWFYDHTIVENISKIELIQYIRDWHIVMVPTSGRDLKNVHYTPPGPRNHIILIIGYDAAKNEFITNDSGTKNGASYRYNEDLIFSAIGYYATSATDSGSLIDKTRKSGIIITKVKS